MARDLQLSEKEAVIVELKQLLTRLPGNEAIQQLSRMHSALRDKSRQLKAMAAELNVREVEQEEGRWKLEKVEREKEAWKKQLMGAQKQKQQLNKSQLLEEESKQATDTSHAIRFGQSADLTSTVLRPAAHPGGKGVVPWWRLQPLSHQQNHQQSNQVP